MPRTASKVTVNNFVGGLVSDFHDLNSPPNTTIDEDNCDLDRRGSRRRRRGIDFESGYVPSTASYDPAAFATLYTKTSEWNSVAELGNTNFLVVQAGSGLSFFDMNFDTLSEGELPFSVDLEDFRAPAYYSTASYGVQVSSGKGALFVVGEAINPFYIEYDPDTNTISTTELTLKVRDLELQDHAMGYQDQFTTLTPQQKYDLYNQGWSATSNVGQEGHGYHQDQVLQAYRTSRGKYPQKAKSWWVGKMVNITFGVTQFSAVEYDTAYVGSTLAPLGTFILEAFRKDRSGVSGVSGLSVEVENSRPTAVAFSAGRVFYGFKNKIMFSQLIEDDLTVAENCFQEADPTAEKINDLIATDGGVIPILESSTIFTIKAFQNALFVFSSAGVWALGGSAIGSGFSATDFSLYKVTEAGALSPRSVCSVVGTPVWWSKLGIFTLTPDQQKQGYSATNLLENKLQLFYNDIPPLSKLYATGAYDKTKKVLTWIYNDMDAPIGDNPYVCNRVLNFDTILKAFYPYTVATLTGGAAPYITDVFNTQDIVATVSEETVVDVLDHEVLDLVLDEVTINVTTLGNASNSQSSLKFLTFYKET